MNGLINVLKPPNMTSHDVVGFLRRITGIKKIGHTGTLDPMAAGVLPVCIGKATRVAEYFNYDQIRKTYRAELKLGIKTDTQDAYGKIIESTNKERSTDKELINAFKHFTGLIEQVPPMFSAKKVNGKKLYELAREGITIERKKREVNIYGITLVNKSNDESLKRNKFLFDVECSSGTYVRTICNDVGDELGTFGYMSFLLRTKVGKFQLKDALTIEEIEKLYIENNLENYLYSADYPLEFLDKIEIEKKYFNQILNGMKLPLGSVINFELKDLNMLSNEEIESKEYRIYCKDKFIGVGYIEDSLVRMRKVLFSLKDGI